MYMYMHAHTHILTELPRHACEQKAVTCNNTVSPVRNRFI